MPRQGYADPSASMKHIIARVIYVAWEDMNGRIESTLQTRGREDKMKREAEEWIGSPVYQYYLECLGYDPSWGLEDMEMLDI